MAEVNNPRQWKKIARELAQERDSDKILALSLELNRALEKQVEKEKLLQQWDD